MAHFLYLSLCWYMQSFLMTEMNYVPCPFISQGVEATAQGSIVEEYKLVVANKVLGTG